MTVKTLFIGLDGATFTVLNDLTKDKGDAPVMPFLGRIMAGGVRAKLRSTPNPLTPPAWVSMMTGRTPGHHGVYDFIRAEERGNDVFFTLFDARDCRVETIWSIASRQCKRIAALNFPFTAPPPKTLNGSVLPGFVPWRHLRRNSHPEGLYDIRCYLCYHSAKLIKKEYYTIKSTLFISLPSRFLLGRTRHFSN